jgi:uncharacterized protein (DUF2267 family)
MPRKADGVLVCRSVVADDVEKSHEENVMTLPATIRHAEQQVQQWLKELCDNGDLADLDEALAVLRVVLHQLRDRLSVEEAVDLAQQLPIIVRGFYFEGWQPSRVPSKVHSRRQLADETTIALLPRTVPAERAIRDVLALLAHHCDPGEIADVIAQLPQELKELWPESAQTYRERMRAAKGG